MKLSFLLLTTLLIFGSGPAGSQDLDLAAHNETAFVPGQILVQIPSAQKSESLLFDLRILDGVSTGLKFESVISKPMDIYLLSFDQDVVNPFDMLKAVKAHPVVTIAQFNHYVEQRETTPNDPNFNQQWHHVNNGGGGGTSDADIDSDEAWDITTGGTTALGDEIVVCVIEGGNLNHPDLQDNAWVNEQETPNNGIDDDGNGYIDDYLGWNVNSNDDSGVLQGGHGTQVMGMIGAQGDNDLGVAGANWNVKIMSVAGENLGNEASVVAAYTYPLEMRQLYTETNGASGAFVVATNASWGINNGNPDNYPIWCEVYQTLGENGILSCGATSNSNVNIDDVGDMPTACPSPYMVSVTATDNSDVRTFSAYGIINVDVGAPGDNVYTTSGTDGYGTTSGTSFASPLTAGVIGLLYAAPCASLIQIAKADPQQGADLVLQALYEGVDIVPNLIDEVATGGRINSFNSLTYLIDNCIEAGCLAPFSPTVTQEPNTTNYTLGWSGVDVDEYDLRYRIVGDANWIEVADLTEDAYLAMDLQYCTEYEFQVRSNCDEETSDYTDSVFWTTDGCCENPNLTAGEILPNSAIISWESVLAAESFNLRYRIAGTTPWIEINEIEDIEIGLDGLLECSVYEIQIQTECIDDEQVDFSESVFFNTGGCETCQDLDYCASEGGNSSEEWIESVEFSSFTNVSGENGGYLDNSDEVHLMVIGSVQEFTLTPGYSADTYAEHFRIWIDYNQDGDFEDSNELVYDSGTGITAAVSGSFTVSEDGIPGATKMRITMKYVGTGGPWGGEPDDAAEPCELYDYGETEDYCVFLDQIISVGEDLNTQINVFPNPAVDEVVVDLSQTDLPVAELNYQLLDMTGRLIENSGFISNRETISIAHLQNGIYSLVILEGTNRIATKQIVKTK